MAKRGKSEIEDESEAALRELFSPSKSFERARFKGGFIAGEARWDYLVIIDNLPNLGKNRKVKLETIIGKLEPHVGHIAQYTDLINGAEYAVDSVELRVGKTMFKALQAWYSRVQTGESLPISVKKTPLLFVCFFFFIFLFFVLFICFFV